MLWKMIISLLAGTSWQNIDNFVAFPLSLAFLGDVGIRNFSFCSFLSRFLTQITSLPSRKKTLSDLFWLFCTKLGRTRNSLCLYSRNKVWRRVLGEVLLDKRDQDTTKLRGLFFLSICCPCELRSVAKRTKPMKK